MTDHAPSAQPAARTLLACVNRRAGEDRPSCAANGSLPIVEALEAEAALQGGLAVKRVHCLGQCHIGPAARLAPGGRFFHKMTADQVPAIIAECRTALLPEIR